MFWEQLDGGEVASRRAWAAAIRAPIANYPKAAAFCRSTARKRVSCGNRRSGKTESAGREHLARAIERDNYVCWVFAGDLGEYSRNWLLRRPSGALQMLLDHVPPNLWRVHRPGGHVRRIDFPSWGSSIEVFSAKDEAQIEKARGGRLSALLLDEAQKLPFISKLLLEIVGPAGADFKAEVWLQGTPGTETDSLFCRAAEGALAGWDVHDLYSWDNPHFGATWRERYERAVYEEIAEFAGEAGLTEQQLQYLWALDEEGAKQIEEHEIGERLPAHIRREYFRVWIAEGRGLVFALAEVPAAYWGDWAPTITEAARGEGRLEHLLAEPDAWKERLAALPVEPWRGRRRRKPWRALIGVDFGYFPDPFALVAMVWSPHDRAIYELGSGKALRLGEDEQRAALEHWVTELRKLRVRIGAVIVDSSGGASTSITDTWQRRLAERFKCQVHPAEKWRTAKVRQIWLMNADIRQLQLLYLRNSPLAVEAEHLEWEITPTGKRVIAKHREVVLADTKRCVPGDHCLDAQRYAWFWSEHIQGRELPEEDDPRDPAVWERRAAERDLSGASEGPRVVPIRHVDL